MIKVYTDGACIGNPGPGGWGAVILGDGGQRVVHGNHPDTTNNRMEIVAVIEGLRDIPSQTDVTVVSDSKYVINTITKNWKRNRNQDLWELLEEEIRARNVTWEWVKGHAGDRFNEEADRLAHAEAVGKLVPDETGICEEDPMGKEESGLLTHIDEQGLARMVDVGTKPDTERIAVAMGHVKMQPSTLKLIRENSFKKGDVLAVANIAGVMGGKRTSDLIPLCHPLPITQITIAFELDEEGSKVNITGTAKTRGKTGVEMEALTAVSIAALTIYDMCKSVDRGMSMDTRLRSKSGGQSGDIVLD